MADDSLTVTLTDCNIENDRFEPRYSVNEGRINPPAASFKVHVKREKNQG